MKKLALVLALILLVSCAGIAAADGERTLTVRCLYHSNVVNQAKEGIDYNDNYVVKALEEASGIDLVMETSLSNATDELQKKIMMCASKEAPDAFVTYYNSGEYYELATQGLLRPLDEYLTDEYLANYLKYVDGDFLDKFRVDGVLYGLPDYVEQACNPTSGILVRKDLFDQMGIEVPVTLDDFYAMLVKAKEMWPDKIPFGTTEGNYNFMQISFNCHGTTCDDGNGGRVYNYTTEGYRDFLTFMNKLYTEGLIETEYATMTSGQKNEKIINDGYFSQLTWWAGPCVNYQNVFNTVEGCEFFFIPYPVTKDGAKGTVVSKTLATHMVMIPTTTSDEKAKLAIEYLNFYASDFALRVSLYGVEGENYTLKDETATGWYIPDAVEQTLAENLAVGWRILYDWFTTPAHFEARAEIKHYDVYYNALMAVGAVGDMLNVNVEPHAIYAKSEDYADIYNMTGCADYVSEQQPLFISGARPLNEWDDFQKELIDRGLEDLSEEMNKWADSFK